MENEVSFVEWMEEFVSQEKGSRIVHYLLKDSEGNSVLAVVGTERSLRHMVYVVADEYLSYSGEDDPVQAGFKWRSRKEVVDWLTSLLAKQQLSDSPGVLTRSFGLSAQHFSVADKTDDRVRNKQSCSDIAWLGVSWTCGKQLKHFPAFCRNGTTIAVQSFVFVMAKEENRYIAYLDDMYEDKKGQKKVKVRWFHHSHEVKGVVRLRNSHPKEVYITPHTQVISVECVDGPAIVLTREHFEKCIGDFPDNLLGKVHLCFRQFRSNKIKPFDISKLKGYFDQPLISCLDSDTFTNSDSGFKMCKNGEVRGQGIKRTRNSEDRERFLTSYNGLEDLQQKKIMRASLLRGGYSSMCDRKALFSKNADFRKQHTQQFKVDDKIELLCQDSGIRGCWFRCTVLEISRKQMKLRYDDLEDQDGCGNLEEWVPAFRLTAPDKLGMRRLGRPTIRPCPPTSNILDAKFDIGDPVDAWWSDGLWEGVVTEVNNGENGNLQVYAPGENLFLNVPREDVRISRDWVCGKWIDVKENRDILAAIGLASKLPTSLTVEKDEEADKSVHKTEVDRNEDKEAVLATSSPSVGHTEQNSSSSKAGCDDDLQCNKSDDQNVKTNGGVEREYIVEDEAMKISDLNEDDGKVGDGVVKNVASVEGKSGDEEDKEASPPNDKNIETSEGVESEKIVEDAVVKNAALTEGKSGDEEDKEASPPNDEQLVTVQN